MQWSDGLWYKARILESTTRSSLVKFTDGSVQKVNNELISTDDENESDEEEDVTEDEMEQQEGFGERSGATNNASSPIFTAISKRRRDYHSRVIVSPFSLRN